MTTAAIFTGGIQHAFEAAAPALGRILENAGFSVRITCELEELLGWLESDPGALLVVYALRWSMTQDPKYEPHRARWALRLAPRARERIVRHVTSGAGLLGVHTASICFDDWPEWPALLGGAWRWGRSWHPEPGPVSVRLHPDHVVTRGLPDFCVTDEVYTDLDIGSDIQIAGRATTGPRDDPAAGAPRATVPQPVLWLRSAGAGRVAYDSLGHDAASLEHPTHRRILQRAALWACGRPDHEVEAI